MHNFFLVSQPYLCLVNSQDIDYCNLPQFCTTGTSAPDATDCTTYKFCDNGQWITMPCGAGLEFDSVDLVCNFPPVRCLECPVYTGTTTEEATNPSAGITIKVKGVTLNT